VDDIGKLLIFERAAAQVNHKCAIPVIANVRPRMSEPLYMVVIG